MLDVLIPTYQRHTALAVTLTALCFQTLLPERIVVADQSDAPAADIGEIRAVVALLRHRGVETCFVRNLPRRGLAQQRQTLLEHGAARQVLFLDDDVVTEPWLLETLSRKLTEAGCGFVGSAVIGLGWIDDVRPHQQGIEFWDGPPTPERIVPGSPEWHRHTLHNAANLLHVQQRLGIAPEDARLYKVAWTGGCVLFDRAMLIAAGGFRFWRDLPRDHAGEDVHAQQRVMERFGGAGLIPSGAYHQELATTVVDRDFDVPRELPLLTRA